MNPSVNSLYTYKQVSHHTFLHGSTGVAGEKLMTIRPGTTGGCLPLRKSPAAVHQEAEHCAGQMCYRVCSNATGKGRV